MDNNTSAPHTPVTQPGTSIPNATQIEKRYEGWLVSNSFVKRALAVTGYSIVGQFIIYGMLLALFIALAGVATVLN